MKRLIAAYLMLSSLLLILPAPAMAEEGSLVINEIMANPSCVKDSLGEWFEVYNPGDEELCLLGWTFIDGNRDSFCVDVDVRIAPNGYAIFGRCDEADRNGGVIVDYKYGGMYLSNTSDSIIALSPEGVVVDQVGYSDDDFGMVAGASLELLNPSLPNDLPKNWSTAKLPYGDGDLGSPGERNGRFKELAKPSAVPLLALQIIFQKSSPIGSEWVSSLGEPEGGKESPTQSTSPENKVIGVIVQTNVHTALFCDNKSQYYDHTKSSYLFELLKGLSYDVKVHSDGRISKGLLCGVDLLLITNPQQAFGADEVEAIEDFMASGGKVVLSAQYHKYIMDSELNRISSGHGILFTRTEILDELQNTGRPYYPKMTFEQGDPLWHYGIKELHLANCSALDVRDGKAILVGGKTCFVEGPDGEAIDMEPCIVATSSDGSLLCFSSSTLLTTSLYRADNAKLVRWALEGFVI